MRPADLKIITITNVIVHYLRSEADSALQCL